MTCYTAAGGHVAGGHLLPGRLGTPWCPLACPQTLYCFCRRTSSGCLVLRQGGWHFGGRGQAPGQRQGGRDAGTWCWVPCPSVEEDMGFKHLHLVKKWKENSRVPPYRRRQCCGLRRQQRHGDLRPKLRARGSQLAVLPRSLTFPDFHSKGEP